MARARPHPVILLHIDAPPKPAPGAACNGCGVCCQAEPCPLGMLLSGRRHGACDALRWSPAEKRYRCGALTAPTEVAAAALPGGLRWLHPLAVGLLRRLAARWIAAGSGCDSWLDATPSSTMQSPTAPGTEPTRPT